VSRLQCCLKHSPGGLDKRHHPGGVAGQTDADVTDVVADENVASSASPATAHSTTKTNPAVTPSTTATSNTAGKFTPTATFTEDEPAFTITQASQLQPGHGLATAFAAAAAAVSSAAAPHAASKEPATAHSLDSVCPAAAAGSDHCVRGSSACSRASRLDDQLG